MRIVSRGRRSARGGGAMWIVFSGRMRSVLRDRGKGLNLIVLNGLSLFIVIILHRHRGTHRPFSSSEMKMRDS